MIFNRLKIPMVGSKKLMIDKEINELRSILDKIEKEIHGHPISDTCSKLIKRSMTMANGQLSGCLNFKKFSDNGKGK